MANELQFLAPSLAGSTIKAMLLREGTRWDGSAWSATSTISDANYGASGIVTLTEQDTSDTTGTGWFVGDLPAGLNDGTVDVFFFDTTITPTTDYVGQAELEIADDGAGGYVLITTNHLDDEINTVNTNVTTNNSVLDAINDKLGAFAGSGLNTVIGFLRALAAKAGGLTPSDLSSGTTYDNTTDSLEALSDDTEDVMAVLFGVAKAHIVQYVTVNGSPTGGTFTLSYDGATTATIAYNAAASAVDTALEALSTIGSSNVAVTGSAGGPYTVDFSGGALDQNTLKKLTATYSSLTGGTSPTVTVDTTVKFYDPADGTTLVATVRYNNTDGNRVALALA